MDDLKGEFKQHKGTYITCGVLALLSMFGGIMAVLGPKIGDNNAALLGLGVIVFIILTSIAAAKGIRLAKVLAGILLIVIGLGATGFILYDFVGSLFTGESIMGRGLTPAITARSLFFLPRLALAFSGWDYFNWVIKVKRREHVVHFDLRFIFFGLWHLYDRRQKGHESFL